MDRGRKEQLRKLWLAGRMLRKITVHPALDIAHDIGIPEGVITAV